jgi:hypothetical protein
MLFKNPVRTSKRTLHFTITNINRLTLVKEINHTKHVNTQIYKLQELLIVRHIVTTKIWRVNTDFLSAVSRYFSHQLTLRHPFFIFQFTSLFILVSKPRFFIDLYALSFFSVLISLIYWYFFLTFSFSRTVDRSVDEIRKCHWHIASSPGNYSNHPAECTQPGN